MPKYDLRCEVCEIEFVSQASMSERTNNLINCPECGGNRLAAIFRSPPAFLKREAKCPSSATCGSSGCRYAS